MPERLWRCWFNRQYSRSMPGHSDGPHRRDWDRSTGSKHRALAHGLVGRKPSSLPARGLVQTCDLDKDISPKRGQGVSPHVHVSAQWLAQWQHSPRRISADRWFVAFVLRIGCHHCTVPLEAPPMSLTPRKTIHPCSSSRVSYLKKSQG